MVEKEIQDKYGIMVSVSVRRKKTVKHCVCKKDYALILKYVTTSAKRIVRLVND